MQEKYLPKAAASIPQTETHENQEESGVSKEAKRAERLKILRERQEKALTAQAAAEKRTQDINSQIAKIEQDIHKDEIKMLDELCKKNDINYKEIAEFLNYPHNMELFRRYISRKEIINEQGND
ncbi:MAG: hypothetical protein K6C13_08095 [Oscillospiraceae bacterium]|nr:hypothetical protein [Oscillospiraceae bacterium]